MSCKIQALKAWIRRDPVTMAAAVAAALSSFLVPPDAGYRTYLDSKVLICLFSLMLAVEMLREASLFTYLAGSLVNRTAGSRRLVFLLVGLTYFLAMILTNDVALITLVPLSMIIFRLLDDPQGLIRIIVLQSLAANVGSALTPIGNPQNLYLFTHYAMRADAFIQAVLPVSLAGAALLLVLIARISNASLKAHVKVVALKRDRSLAGGTLVFLAAIGCVLGFWNEWILLTTTALLSLLQIRALTRVDYSLLLTFVFFFILSGNLSRLPALRDWAASWLAGPRQVMVSSALASQLISNVPAAILLSGFTDLAGPLLRGVNVGGCGTLIASLASVIAYKIYCREAPDAKAGKKRFLLLFAGYNLLFLILLMAVALLAPYRD